MSNPNIHPTAIIESGAKIAATAIIGPYCTVGKNVELADHVHLISHVVIMGHTKIGEKTQVWPFAVLGGAAQHTHHMNDTVGLVIGKNNMIREHATMHSGTTLTNHPTKIGDNGFFMVGTHIAHDCLVGNNVIMMNNATLAGHVTVEDGALLGGLSAVHQRCRIGKMAMIGGMTGIERDIIPYGMAIGDRARLAGLNIVGLKRQNFTHDDIHNMRKAYRMLFANEGTLAERVKDVAETFKDFKPVQDIVTFINADTERNICLPE